VDVHDDLIQIAFLQKLQGGRKGDGSFVINVDFSNWWPYLPSFTKPKKKTDSSWRDFCDCLGHFTLNAETGETLFENRSGIIFQNWSTSSHFTENFILHPNDTWHE